MSLLNAAYRWFEHPHRFLALRELGDSPTILDVGCGNHSPTLTKKYFPGATYHGVANEEWNLDARDRELMDAFFQLDLDTVGDLDTIPNGQYDAVICSHILEHVDQYERVIGWLAQKLKPGGILYVEVPSARSLSFPRAKDGFLGVRGCWNFYDDPTHKVMVNLGVVQDKLRAGGLQVSEISTRRLWRRVLLLPAYAAAGIATRGYIPASVLWDISGFAEVLTARR